jgi:hypothetical protein
MTVMKHLSSLLIESDGKFNEVDAIMDYEQGNLSDEDTIKLFSHLVKTGKVWSLHGHYGRMAKSLIDGGYIDKKGNTLKTESLHKGTTIAETKNTDVIDMFINDTFPKDKKTTWGTQHLKINKENNGWSLVNYATVIVYRPNDEDKVYLNKKKYSITTSKIQNQIRNVAKNNNVELTETDEIGITDAMRKGKPAASKHAEPEHKEGKKTSLFSQEE